MWARKMLVMLGMAALIAGCVPSLHPLYTEKELVFEPTLVGTWVESKAGEEIKEKDVWTFKKSGENAYELTITQGEYSKPLGKSEPGEPGKFEAHLVRLGDFLFLDIYPDEPDIKNDFYKLHLIPAHTFWRIGIEGDILRLAYLEPKWLDDMIDEKKVNLAHERLGDRTILTASTKELQEFLLKYVKDPKAFSEPGEFHRQK